MEQSYTPKGANQKGNVPTIKANKQQLYRDVEFLTSISPARNYLNLESLDKVADYIAQEFSKCGTSPEFQPWIADKREYKNIIASYNPDKSRRLIVGAHYDVYGDQPGADDNASAVAGLLELARMVFEQQPEIDYRIDFVAYCLEEPPYFTTDQMGSFIHAKSLYDAQVDVIGMVCLEMIGYFSDEPGSQPYPLPELASIYPSVANFIIVVGIDQFADFSYKVYQLMSNGSAIDVQIINFPSPDMLADMSDHRNYWKYGYNALMINDTAFIRNPHYHLPSDTIDTLDFEKMTHVVNSTYNAIINMG
jgi:hypothetical protein